MTLLPLRVREWEARLQQAFGALSNPGTARAARRRGLGRAGPPPYHGRKRL